MNFIFRMNQQLGVNYEHILQFDYEGTKELYQMAQITRALYCVLQPFQPIRPLTRNTQHTVLKIYLFIDICAVQIVKPGPQLQLI